MKTIDILTTQNVLIDYELASLRDRFFAILIDFIVLMIGYFALLTFLVSTLQGMAFESSMGMYVLLVLLPIGGFVGYHFLFEVFNNGQSLGKKALSIKVMRLDGKEPGLSDYLLRAVFQLIDLLSSLGVVGAMLISSSSKNQRLGDLTASTTVVRLRQKINFKLEDILKIDSREAYAPKYPQIIQMSEQDMLLVKEVINRYQQFRNPAHAEALLDLVDVLKKQLQIDEIPTNKLEFLKTLIKDYIVLTR